MLNERTQGRTSVVKSMAAILPVSARNVVYKDPIGNVSTSNFRREQQRAVLQITPRYPLFGGWRFTWLQGYDIPLSDSVTKTKRDDEYSFKVPVSPSIRDISVGVLKVKVILPEGATYHRLTQ